MTLRLMTLITLLVHVDFTESGGKPNLRKYPVNDEERKREQELELKKEENARLRHQMETKDLQIIKLEQKVKAIEHESAGWASTAHIYEEIVERDDKRLGHFLDQEVLGHSQRIYRQGIEDEEWNSRTQMLAEELTKQRNAAQQEKEKNKELNQINENLVKQLAEKQDQEVSTSESPIHKQSKLIEKWREDQDLEMNKMKGELQAIENERSKWQDEAKRLQKILEWREGAIETLKGKNNSLLWKYFECTSRAAIEREAMDTRMHLWIEELLQQRMLGGKQVIETNNWKETMEKQLEEARRRQEICVPDSPINKQVGPTCLNVATASWMRKTLTKHFFHSVLPAHDKIVCNIGDQSSADLLIQIECIKKEAARWNLDVVELDVWKEGGFDRAHEHLIKGDALWWALQPREWGPIKDHIKDARERRFSKYLGHYEWTTRKHKIAGGHSMVITQYIKPEADRPGLYRIKNSHGENGGSHGQKGYVLIEDKVFREIKPEYLFVAIPKDIAAEALMEGA